MLTVAMNKTLMPKLVPSLHYRSMKHVEPSLRPRGGNALQERATALNQQRPLADPLKTVIIIMKITPSPSQCMSVPVSSRTLPPQLAGLFWLRPVIECINRSCY